jgi:WD40 repeat protein
LSIVSSRASLLLCCAVCGSLQCGELLDSQLIKHVFTLLQEVNCLQFDDSKCVSGSGDHSIKVWDTKTGTLLCNVALRRPLIVLLSIATTYSAVLPILLRLTGTGVGTHDVCSFRLHAQAAAS